MFLQGASSIFFLFIFWFEGNGFVRGKKRKMKSCTVPVTLRDLGTMRINDLCFSYDLFFGCLSGERIGWRVLALFLCLRFCF